MNPGAASSGLACPLCGALLPAGLGAGFFELSCPACAQAISLAKGKLITTNASRIVIERATSRRDGTYVFMHTFSIFAQGAARMYSYRVGRDGCANVLPKNTDVSFAYALVGPENVRGALVSVLTGYRFDLPTDAVFETRAVGALGAGADATATPAAEPSLRSERQAPPPAPAFAPAARPYVSRSLATQPLPCPVCNKPFVDPSADGYVETVCGSCQTQFAVVTGTLSNPTSTRIVHQRQGTKQMGIYSYFHQFSVFIPGGFKAFSYTTRTRVGGITFSKGERASVVCTRRDSQMQDLVYVYSHILAKRIDVAGAGAYARRQATIVACCVGTGIAVLLWLAVGMPFLVAFLVGAALGALAGVASWRATSPKTKLAESARTRASARARLLELKADTVTKRELLARDCTRANDRIQRFDLVEAKMLRVGPELYETRLKRLREARSGLADHVRRGAHVLTEYDRFVEMLELELEGELPDDALDVEQSSPVLVRLEEIQRIEAGMADLRIQIESNEEVERLLEGSGSPAA